MNQIHWKTFIRIVEGKDGIGVGIWSDKNQLLAGTFLANNVAAHFLIIKVDGVSQNSWNPKFQNINHWLYATNIAHQKERPMHQHTWSSNKTQGIKIEINNKILEFEQWFDGKERTWIVVNLIAIAIWWKGKEFVDTSVCLAMPDLPHFYRLVRV
jgi:hypothetical protein